MSIYKKYSFKVMDKFNHRRNIDMFGRYYCGLVNEFFYDLLVIYDDYEISDEIITFNLRIFNTVKYSDDEMSKLVDEFNSMFINKLE